VISRALHLNVFDQPVKNYIFNNLIGSPLLRISGNCNPGTFFEVALRTSKLSLFFLPWKAICLATGVKLPQKARLTEKRGFVRQLIADLKKVSGKMSGLDLHLYKPIVLQI
jgi:hypothetical protein